MKKRKFQKDGNDALTVLFETMTSGGETVTGTLIMPIRMEVDFRRMGIRCNAL